MMIDLCAIDLVVGSIKDIVGIVDQAHSCHPVVDSVGPVIVRGVASDSKESSGELEEKATAD